MGVDWHRMKPKPGVDVEELRQLACNEAVAYQSMNGWYPVRDTDWLALRIQNELHSAAYAAARTAFRERVEPAVWDHERQCATDHPDLTTNWRVLVISGNPIFPPLVQCRAFRTILPDELPDQLTRWREWAEGVSRGEHDDYLRELHWYTTADWAMYHWSCLHRAATHSLTATGKWGSRAELVAVRDDILRVPIPTIPRIHADPSLRERLNPLDFENEYPAMLTTARTLAELTRRWDGCVRGNKKMRYYEECYRFTLDEFRAQASGRWLGEFFTWAGRCVELGFGLALD